MSTNIECIYCGVAIPGSALNTKEAVDCPGCGEMLYAQDGRVGVVIAYENRELSALAAGLVNEAGYWPILARTGTDAHGLCERFKSKAVILQAGIDDPPAFLATDLIRRGSNAATKIILVSTVYNREAYKRRPTNLYGADDYLEQFEVEESLVPILKRQLSGVLA